MKVGTLARIGSSALALIAGACATLPDTSAYTAATVQVKQSARSIGDVVAAEIAATADATEDPPSQQEIRDSGGKFTTAWGDVVGSLDAAVHYADSVEEIIAAGNGGTEGARKVADSVSSLAGMLGVAIGPAAGAITETGVAVYRQLALIRAARSLAAAFTAADPAILSLQERMHANVAAARDLFLKALHAQDSELRLDTGLRFYAVRDAQLDPLEKMRLGALADAMIDPRASQARLAALKAQAADVRDARAALADGLARYTARRDALSRRREAGLAAFRATDDAIAAWAEAHARLAVAVRDHRPVTTASLMAAADDLRTVVAKWRDL